ncbi:MAG: hypothetical protein VW397_00010 [Candidatus Margulisiibacteriota bacterium]
MLEVLITLTILSLLMPGILDFLTFQYQQLRVFDETQRRQIEKIDAYQQIQTDIAISNSLDEQDCCLKSNSHYICYDIKQDQIRRRKKKHSSSRFYTVYIGKLKQWETLKCKMKSPLVIFEFKQLDSPPISWTYLLGSNK